MYVVLERRKLHMWTSIFVHKIDWKQNEVAPDWFKFEELSAANGGGIFFKLGAGTSKRQKTMENFFSLNDLL